MWLKRKNSVLEPGYLDLTFDSTLKGNWSWVFTGRTDVEAETPILWPPHAKSWLVGKDPDVGKDWKQEEKGTTEDEMVGWHHRLSGHGFGWTPGVGDGQGGLACCGPWGHKESDTTEQLNWTELMNSRSSEKSLYLPSFHFPIWPESFITGELSDPFQW